MSTGFDATPLTTEPKRAVTRKRLLDAANRRFREHGFDHTTAAGIAADAGVTERTFFRYFPTKADVLVANWQEHADSLRTALAASTKTDLRAVVADGLIAFTDHITAEQEAGLDSVVRLYLDRAAFRAILDTLLAIENDLAVEIARRAERHADEFDVRVAANAAFGVFRAAVRAYVVDPAGPSMADLVRTGLKRLRPVFNALEQPVRPQAHNRR